MGIYNTEGELDLVEAAAELRGIVNVSNQAARKEGVGLIQTAALLDIAGSLRVLATESSFAMQAAGYIELDLSAEPEDEAGETLPDIRPENAPAGSRVRITSRPAIEGVLTDDSGIDQGEVWLSVVWDESPDAPDDGKVWAKMLEVVSLPGAIVELADGTVLGDGVTPPTLSVADESPFRTPEAEAEYMAIANPTADPDDLDDDFAGDEHPAAADAIAALKAREKAAKAAKAKKGKKA